MVGLGLHVLLLSLINVAHAAGAPVRPRVPQYVLTRQVNAPRASVLTAELAARAAPITGLGYFGWLWPPESFDHDLGLTIHLDPRTTVYLEFASLDSAKIMSDLLFYGERSFVFAFERIKTRRFDDGYQSHVVHARDAYVWDEAARRFISLRELLTPLRSSADQSLWTRIRLGLSGRAGEP